LAKILIESNHKRNNITISKQTQWQHTKYSYRPSCWWLGRSLSDAATAPHLLRAYLSRSLLEIQRSSWTRRRLTSWRMFTRSPLT